MRSHIRFEMLDELTIEKLLNAGFSVMEKVGMDIYLPQAVELLQQAGCKADGIRVRIPREVTKKAIATAPNSITIYDRNGQEAMTLTGHNSYFGPGPTCPYFIDPYTQERRPAVKQDTVNTAIIADALHNIDYVMSLCMISDYDKTLADIHEVDAMLRNSTKPITTWAFNRENMETIFQLCTVVAGSREALREKPFLIVYSEPTTPLSHSRDALEKLILAAEYEVPCIYTPGMIMGGTAPATIAGALAVGLADCFTGLVINQLVTPGAPFIGGTSGSPMDMKTMQTPYGAPETSLLLAASNEIMRYIGIPSFDMAGATEAKKIDAQAGIECAFEVMISLLSGGNLIHDCGFLDVGMTGSLDHLVLCDEIIAMAKRYCAAVTVDDDRIGLDNIAAVGPGGNFLASEHTFRYFRSEFWEPTLMERRSHDNWVSDGSLDMTARINTKMKRLLESHQPKPLSSNVTAQLDAIIKKVEDRNSA